MFVAMTSKLPGFWSLLAATPQGLTISAERVATSYKHPPLPGRNAQKLSGRTEGSLDAFLAVECRWVWLRRNVHHLLGVVEPTGPNLRP